MKTDNPYLSVSSVANRSQLQVLDDEVEHHLAHVLEQQWVRDAVAGFRVEHQLKLLPCLLQLIHKLHRVLHVNVVVDRSVDQ